MFEISKLYTVIDEARLLDKSLAIALLQPESTLSQRFFAKIMFSSCRDILE